MKTSKLILITAIMFFASVGFSFTESTTAKVNHAITQDNALIYISIQHAVHIPALAKAIYEQISPNFLVLHHLKDYTFHVIIGRQHYIVRGLYHDWKLFFDH